ncbi:MAG: iron ABC transporter permease [Anaerolineae bacterium]|nr:MAG: iron ABC transporter permease [Anaerolineae bacterium]
MDRSRTALIWRYAGRGLLLTPLLFLLVFFFYPLGSILQFSLAPDGKLDFAAFQQIFSRPYYRETLWFTTWQAALSTLLTLGLAFPAAHVFAKYQFPGKSLLLALATIPFVLPTVVVATAFIALLGEDSALNGLLMKVFKLEEPPLHLERSLKIILLAHIFYNYAVALRIISSFWSNQSQRIQEAAQMLGASRWMVFYRITLPLLLPAVTAAAALVFMFCFTSFGVVRILGGLKYATLEVEIHYQSLSLFDLPTAGALSVIQLMTTLVMMIVYTNLQRQMTQPLNLQSSRQVARKPRRWAEKGWLALNLIVMSLLIFAPILALIERSFTLGDGGFTTRYYEQLQENPHRSIRAVAPVAAIQNSLEYAFFVTIFSVLLGTLAAYLLSQKTRFSRWLDPVFMLPLAASAVTLGFGFIITLDEPPLNLRSSYWIVPIAHTLVAMPLVVRSVLPSLRAIKPSIGEAAAVLGASRWQRWRRIELPLITRSIAVGATFAFTVSMGEFGASSFVARPNQPTIPIVIFRFLGQPGLANYGQALAMSVILMAVCAAGFVLIERLNRAVIGEF